MTTNTIILIAAMPEPTTTTSQLPNFTANITSAFSPPNSVLANSEPALTLVFEVLGATLGLAALIVGYLQLRHMVRIATRNGQKVDQV